MRTSDNLVIPVRKEEKEERPGAGILFSLRQKLGLGPAYPTCAGPAVGVATGGAGGALGAAGGLGATGAAAGRFGAARLLSALLATTPGVISLILASGVVVAGIVAVASSAFSPTAGTGAPSEAFWANLPSRPAAGSSSALGAARADGASSSLDYFSQAAKNDSWLQEKIGGPQPEAWAPTADSAPAAQAEAVREASPLSSVPNVTTATRPLLAKASGFAGQGAGGSASAGGGLRDALASGRPAAGTVGKVYGLAPNRREMRSDYGRKRPLIGLRGARTSDALRFANRDGLSQRGARNPSMQRAGATFDGAAGGIQGTTGDVPTPATFGGISEAPKSRIKPDQVLDQKEVPQPAAPPAEKESTPYKGLMYAAIGALLAAMLLQKMAGQKKEAAKALKGPAKAAALAAAAMLHFMAAAAAAAAAALGAIIMTTYQQKMQGLMFVIPGGLLAAYNLKAALDASKASQDAKKEEEKALGDMNAKGDQIHEQLEGNGDGGNSGNAGNSGSGGGGGGEGGGDGGMSGLTSALQGMNNQPNNTPKPEEKPKVNNTNRKDPVRTNVNSEGVLSNT